MDGDMGKKYLFLSPGGGSMFILQSTLLGVWSRAGSGLSLIC